MNIIFAAALVLSFLAVYMLIIEIFSVAFKLTGLATNRIKFQVASLFTETGFTTNESELIVNDTRRRRIAVACMYTSHIFSVVILGLLINLVISLVASLVNKPTISAETFKSWYAWVFYVSLMLFLVVLIIKIPPINRRFQMFLERIAVSLSRKNRKYNIVSVIDMYGKNAVAEVFLNKIPEFAKDVPLFDMQINKKFSINVLSIERHGRMIEVNKDTMFAQGDIIVVFGLLSDIKEAFVNDIQNIDMNVNLDKVNRLDLLNTYGSNVLMEIDIQEVPQEIDGLTMKESQLTDKYNINVTVIKRDNDYLFVDKDTIIQKGDVITVFGPYKSIKHLFSNE